MLKNSRIAGVLLDKTLNSEPNLDKDTIEREGEKNLHGSHQNKDRRPVGRYPLSKVHSNYLVAHDRAIKRTMNRSRMPGLMKLRRAAASPEDNRALGIIMHREDHAPDYTNMMTTDLCVQGSYRDIWKCQTIGIEP
ncbi:hypothetical protein M8J77_009828 [Diaphorina citri]|nr:hypothetical protein M8J77_009828 [Diaphorina citri]